MLIMVALVPLIVLTFLSVIFGNEFMIIITDVEKIEEEKPVWEWFKYFEDDLMSIAGGGGIAIIVLIAGISILIGIQVLGSGLSDITIKVLTILTAYGSLWIILSLLSMSLLFEIQLFGLFIYTILTLIYVIGMIEKISEGM